MNFPTPAACGALCYSHWPQPPPPTHPREK